MRADAATVIREREKLAKERAALTTLSASKDGQLTRERDAVKSEVARLSRHTTGGAPKANTALFAATGKLASIEAEIKATTARTGDSGPVITVAGGRQ